MHFIQPIDDARHYGVQTLTYHVQSDACVLFRYGALYAYTAVGILSLYALCSSMMDMRFQSDAATSISLQSFDRSAGCCFKGLTAE